MLCWGRSSGSARSSGFRWTWGGVGEVEEDVEGGGQIAAEEKPAVEPDDYERGGTERGDSGGEDR